MLRNSGPWRLTLPDGVIVYTLNRGDRAAKVALRLGSAAGRAVVRLTGGCGGMAEEFSRVMDSSLVPAFDGFRGTLLFGGTRMVSTKDFRTVVPGITEVPPRIAARNEGIVMIGIAPRVGETIIVPGLGHVLYVEDDYVTIVHPDQFAFVLLQKSADEGEPWGAEYKRCIVLINDMRNVVQFRSLHVVYGGGEYTEMEIQAVAALGWPLLLIEGSGGVADSYARDQTFRGQHPCVYSCPNNAQDIRTSLTTLQILQEER
jgi:hypothetical protein